MNRITFESVTAMTNEPKAAMGMGSVAILLVLAAVFIASLWFAYWGWNLTDGVVSSTGMTALVLGVVLSFALGAGLMGLVFWSNRKGYDR